MKHKDNFLLRYYPEKANPIELFNYFCVGELSFDQQGKSLILSIVSRLEKSSILWEHLLEICKMATEKERNEIERYRYSNIRYTKLATSIFEAILDEYYSIYSNFAITFHKIFNVDSPKGKWFKLKKGVINGKYSSIPLEIVDFFKSIKIDEKLKEIRTESAHYSTGDLNIFSKPYSYTNPQIGPIGKTPSNIRLINDIEKFYSQLRNETAKFLYSFFKYVIDNIFKGKKRTVQFCGFYKRYLYRRIESYHDFISGKSGYCKPIWTNNDSVAPPCPLAINCKAYRNYLSTLSKLN